jgi:hypothetical protein
MKKPTRKLVNRKLELRNETIRTLETLDLTRAVGGDALFESGINCPIRRAADTGGANTTCVQVAPANP